MYLAIPFPSGTRISVEGIGITYNICLHFVEERHKEVSSDHGRFQRENRKIGDTF